MAKSKDELDNPNLTPEERAKLWQQTDGDPTNDLTFGHLSRRQRTRLRPQSSAFLRRLMQKEPQMRNKIATGFALMLTLGSIDLETRLAFERLGAGPHLESALRQLLQIQGIQIHPEVNYGQYVPNTIRLFWQEMGMDPDSENEVLEYLNEHALKYLKNPEDAQNALNTLQNPPQLDEHQANALQAILNNRLRPAPKPKPTPSGGAPVA